MSRSKLNTSDKVQPTAHTVAARSGVSQVTVSRVFSGRLPVADATRRKVEKAAKELGYFPNMAARTMRTGQTKVVGIILPGLQVAVTGLKLEDIEQTFAKKGYQAMIAFTEGKSGRVIRAIKEMTSRNVEGVILTHDFSLDTEKQTNEVLSCLKRMGTPCLLNDFPSPTQEYDFPSIRSDLSAMRDVAEHLSSLGLRNVAMWNEGITPRSSKKIRTFIEAAHKHQLEVKVGSFISEDWIDTEYSSSGDYIEEACGKFPITDAEQWPWPRFMEQTLRQSIKCLLADSWQPDALVLSNDRLAMAAIQELFDAGLRIPEDIAVVGYDDIEYARLHSPPLTTVRQQRERQAELAANMLLDQIEGRQLSQKHVILPTELIVRRSTVGRNGDRSRSIFHTTSFGEKSTNEIEEWQLMSIA